jgi:hypothetical protein
LRLEPKHNSANSGETEAYFQFLQTKTKADQFEYRMIRAVLKRGIRRTNRKSVDAYISKVEHDVHGRQETANETAEKLNKTERDRIQLYPISNDEWSRHFRDLRSSEQEEEPSVSNTTHENVDSITVEQLTEAMKYCKNRKVPG